MKARFVLVMMAMACSMSSVGCGSESSDENGGSGSADPRSGIADLIDDLEDGDAVILPNGTPARDGVWYTFGDETTGSMLEPFASSFMPVEGGANGSAYAARMAGSGHMSWGAGMGFNFRDAPGAKEPYDASAYRGVTFWGKAVGPTKLRVNIADRSTEPSAGVCDENTGTCHDHFGEDFTLDTEWQQFTMIFSDLEQVGWSGVLVPAFDPSTAYGIQFQVGVTPPTFEVWIDDVGFIK